MAKTGKRDREELLRPSPYLGYDRDSVGMHLMNCGAFDVAESQLRRAVWVNPYEARFKAHLAWCLYKQGRFDEAKDWAGQSLDQDPDNTNAKMVLGWVDSRGGAEG